MSTYTRIICICPDHKYTHNAYKYLCVPISSRQASQQASKPASMHIKPASKHSRQAQRASTASKQSKKAKQASSSSKQSGRRKQQVTLLFVCRCRWTLGQFGIGHPIRTGNLIEMSLQVEIMSCN